MICWCPPPSGVFKLNTKCLHVNWEASLAEVHAIKFGLGVALEAGFSSLVVEGDSKSTMEALKGGPLVSPYHDLCVTDIWTLLPGFPSSFLPDRVANCLAHHLAKEAFNSPYLVQVWMEDVPPQF